MEHVAEIGAGYAEEIYAELKVRMNHLVTRRIPLIFYNTTIDFQQTNITPGLIPEGVGGFFEFLKGRVVLQSNGSLKDFRHVIRHEIVHVFMTNKVYRILKDHRIPTNKMPPLWLVEGFAEFYSTDWVWLNSDCSKGITQKSHRDRNQRGILFYSSSEAFAANAPAVMR